MTDFTASAHALPDDVTERHHDPLIEQGPPTERADKAVRNLEPAGISRPVAMKLTGHKTEAVYRRDAIVAESDLREAGTNDGGDGRHWS